MRKLRLNTAKTDKMYNKTSKGLAKMNEGVFDTKQAHKLDNPSRIRELRPYELLKNAAGVIKGMTAVDFGSGTGTFAIPMAALVGDAGKVYAIDNSVEMLSHIKAKNPPKNLVLLNNDVERTELPDQIADICLLAFILHEVKQPSNLISEAFRLLKPLGRLVIVEWKVDLDSPGPPKKKRLSQEKIRQLLRRIGMVLDSYTEWTANHYVAIGRNKPEVAAAGFEPQIEPSNPSLSKKLC